MLARLAGIVLVASILTLLGWGRAEGQSWQQGILVKDDGTVKGYAKAIDCGENTTCTSDGFTMSIAASGGTGGAGLAADPAACASGQYVIDQNIAGILSCAQVQWTQLGGVPATFTPAAHAHAYGEITGTPTIPPNVAGEPIVTTAASATLTNEKVLPTCSGTAKLTFNGTTITCGTDTDTVYSHPTGDGNLHVPATSTTNSGKHLTAGGTAGSLSWAFPDWGSITNKPATYPATTPVATATALNADPAACSAGGYVTDIAANGTLTCSTPPGTYVHPATHPPSIIAQDASNRFVTDAQIADWNTDNDTIYTLPAATAAVRGGIKVGSGLSITGDVLAKIPDTCTAPPAASATTLGLVRGTGTALTCSGTDKVIGYLPDGTMQCGTDANTGTYTLPALGNATLGGIKGTGTAIACTGTQKITGYAADGTIQCGADVDTDTVYTHPANHPPSIITQDASNRFVTDAEKTTWNAKEPAITTLSQAKGGTGAGALTCTGSQKLTSNGTAYSCATDADTIYTHPASHPPSIITQDTSNRFVTDAEKTTWNAKEPAITTLPQSKGGTGAGALTCTAGQKLTSNGTTYSCGTDNDTIYTHPATHPPSIIAQDASNRFVTDAQIADWNSDADTIYTHPTGGGYAHIPASVAGDAGKALVATSTPNTVTWAFPDWFLITNKPATFPATVPVSSASALAANGANCPAGQAPLGVDANGAVEGCWTPASTYTLPVSTASVLGGVKIGTGINVTGDGTISKVPDVCTAPPAATATTLGLVRGTGTTLTCGSGLVATGFAGDGTLQCAAPVTAGITSADTRNTNYAPQDRAAGAYFDFKANATDGLADGGSWHGVMTFRPYGSGTDLSGGVVHQIGFTENGRLYSRKSTGVSTWSAWQALGGEPWHVVGAAGEPAFLNNFANYPGWAPARFYKDGAGIVHLSGLLWGGVQGGAIFTLPAGYRPAYNIIVTGTGAGPGINAYSFRIDVGSNGNVIMASGTGGLGTSGNYYLSLDGITFRAEQ